MSGRRGGKYFQPRGWSGAGWRRDHQSYRPSWPWPNNARGSRARPFTPRSDGWSSLDGWRRVLGNTLDTALHGGSAPTVRAGAKVPVNVGSVGGQGVATALSRLGSSSVPLTPDRTW